MHNPYKQGATFTSKKQGNALFGPSSPPPLGLCYSQTGHGANWGQIPFFFYLPLWVWQQKREVCAFDEQIWSSRLRHLILLIHTIEFQYGLAVGLGLGGSGSTPGVGNYYQMYEILEITPQICSGSIELRNANIFVCGICSILITLFIFRLHMFFSISIYLHNLFSSFTWSLLYFHYPPLLL